MLSKQAFIAGMRAFKSGYIGWEFDLNDNIQIGFWYSALKNLSDSQFKSLLSEYYAHNKYPPRCVRDLTEILVTRTLSQAQIKPDKALSVVRDTITDCGGWDYEGRSEIYQRLKKYPALYETVKEFERELQTMRANDPFVEDRFRKSYEARLKDSATARVDKMLGLNIPEPTKVLGPGALPYEE